MVTDRPPRDTALLAEFLRSDRATTLDVPRDDRFFLAGKLIETAMQSGRTSGVKAACEEFLALAAAFYSVPRPALRVLAARPLRVREGGWATELFGDYNPATSLMRVWLRTAVRKQVTSFGTFLSTVCHEFCHHLDLTHFGLKTSPHTRGFYQRTAALYHNARGTPLKRLYWAPMPGERWRIDWPRTNRGF